MLCCFDELLFKDELLTGYVGAGLLCEGVYEEWDQWPLQLVSNPKGQLGG